MLDLEHPFAVDDVDTGRTRNQMPRLILNQRSVLCVHRRAPVRQSESDTVVAQLSAVGGRRVRHAAREPRHGPVLTLQRPMDVVPEARHWPRWRSRGRW
jgi:hypothetical protein